METDKKEKDEKQAYERPALRIIELSAEEVLAVGCKTGSSGFASGHPPPCMAHNCAGVGS